nr:MAG TPA: hypothetical protein [Caudoviricetes sp.]
MAQDYIKTEWVDKETQITAERMNKLEEQIDIITDDVISMVKKINDLEVKLHYSNPSSKNEVVEEVKVSDQVAKIKLEPGKAIKAMRIVNVPEEAVKWQNTLSTFFGADKDGKGTGNTNPASTAPEGTKFEHIGNLDPMLGVQELDRIQDLYSILSNFDFSKAQEVELKTLQQYFPTTVKISRVRHTINILNAKEEVIQTLKVDMYNPN